MQTADKKTKTSKLESFKLFYEHTDDSRKVVDRQMRPIRRPTLNVASRR